MGNTTSRIKETEVDQAKAVIEYDVKTKTEATLNTETDKNVKIAKDMGSTTITNNASASNPQIHHDLADFKQKFGEVLVGLIEYKQIQEFKLAAEKENILSLYSLGIYYNFGIIVTQDYKKAIYYYKEAAKRGHASSQYCLGEIFEQDNVVFMDRKKSVEYYTLAAKQGHSQAQVKLGLALEKGQGIGKNEKSAVEYYTLAAKQNDKGGQYCLASCYHFGIGVSKDIEKALEYYILAAEKREVNALHTLGLLYITGTDVTKDINKAIKYFRQAADQNHQPSKEALAAATSPVNVSTQKVVSASAAGSAAAPATIDCNNVKLEAEKANQDSPVIRKIAQQMIMELDGYIKKAQAEIDDESYIKKGLQMLASGGGYFPSNKLGKAVGSNKPPKIQNAYIVKGKIDSLCQTTNPCLLSVDSLTKILDDFSIMDNQVGGGIVINSFITKYKNELSTINNKVTL